MNDHRDALEAELLAEFDRRHPPHERKTRRARLAPLLAAAALLIGILAAARAPADYAVELGQRIEVRAPAGSRLPQGSELSTLVEEGLASAGGEHKTVEIRVVREKAGEEVLRVDVWGAPISGIAERLRAKLPALASARIAVTGLSGRVHTSVAGLLGHRLLKLGADPRALEEARRELQAEMAARGHPGRVDIQVEPGKDGKHRVRIEMKREN